MASELKTPAFDNGGTIPLRHARDGENLSPFLEWSDPPPGTKSYVLVMEDIDASTVFRHWAVYDIPGQRCHIAEGRSSKASAENLVHAYNDFGNLHYDGPDAVRGRGHNFRFRLAALAVDKIGIAPEADASTVWEAARHHLLGEAEIVGRYG